MTSILAFLKRLWPFGRRQSPRPTSAAANTQPSELPIEVDERREGEGEAVAREAPPPDRPDEVAISPERPIERAGATTPDAKAAAVEEETQEEEAAAAAESENDREEAEEDEDWAAEAAAEDEDPDPLAPDPFISADAPTIEALEPEALTRKRAESMALALGGDHRVFLSDAAGPGTLAEALNQLLQEDRVTAEFHPGDEDGPYILYSVKP